MATVIPFRGLLYSPLRVPDLKPVVAPPYDVISAEKDEEYRRRHPHNVAHLILPRPEGEFDKYRNAARLLSQWQKDGVLVRDETPCFYVVSQRYSVKGQGERTRFGLVARVRIEDGDSKTILPHERTMDAPRADRTELLHATRMHLSQIFILYSDPEGTIGRSVEAFGERPPERWAVDDAGTEAKLWRLTDRGMIRSITEGLRDRTMWIADGHHRYEASRALRDKLRAEDRSAPGTRSYDYVMCYLTSMDSAGVTILPYHRAVRDVEGLDRAHLLKKSREFFDVKEFSFEGFDPRADQIRRKLREAARGGRNVYAAYTGPGAFQILLVKESLDRARHLESLAEPLRHLDVSVLHHLLLEKSLGLSLERQREEGGPLRYTDDIDRALAWVDAGEAQVALLLNPTAKEHLMAVAGGGLQMPQKSTYFYPKVLTGLVMNPIDPVDEVAEPAPAAHAG
ncbi:MAG: DUF1015 domain-containing protein [Acidobacteria bacterium]|nr:DUF1015 domain-containing protein [Acidobacteriota bacterium]